MTMAAKNIYEEELRKWQQQFQNTAAAKPADYQSQYTPQMQSAMSQYQNQKPFEYDVNADALYQQMKDSYTRSGKMAMQDTMGKAAAMTGGYGNTFAQVAGQQQYGQYMQGLNDNIPALQDRAYQRYQDEGGKLLNQFNLAGQMEGLDYQKYQDALGNWQNQRGFDYGAMQDAQGQVNWQNQFDYGQQRDTVADTQWQSQFDYGKQRDTVGDAQWQEQFQYGQTQDNQAQANWDKQFNYGVQSDQKDQAFSLAMTGFQGGKMPPAELLTQAGIDEQTANLLTQLYAPKKSGVSKKEKEITLNFKPDEIAAALKAKQEGGEKGLETYTKGLIGQGKGDEQAMWLYEYADQNMEQQKGVLDFLAPIGDWFKDAMNLK
jgi:hypothetical protein